MCMILVYYLYSLTITRSRSEIVIDTLGAAEGSRRRSTECSEPVPLQ